jgi:hypothetical protein
MNKIFDVIIITLLIVMANSSAMAAPQSATPAPSSNLARAIPSGRSIDSRSSLQKTISIWLTPNLRPRLLNWRLRMRHCSALAAWFVIKIYTHIPFINLST